MDGSGNVYLTGSTHSSDFPTTAGAFDTTYDDGTYDTFVAKLNPTGGALYYATFLGGDDYDDGYVIAVDDSGNAYLTGRTLSFDFLTTSGAFDETHNGSYEAFVAKPDPTGSALDYATFLGGIWHDGGEGITLDESGNAYVTGSTSSDNFPTTAGAFDNTFNGNRDVFVVKLNPTGSALDYATFPGGSDDDQGSGIAVDGSGIAHVAGYTNSDGFPTTAGAFDTTHNGGGFYSWDVFVAKLNPTGSILNYATFLGGSDDDQGRGIATDNSGNVYVTGFTESDNFPTTAGAFDSLLDGSTDIFVTKLSLGGTPVVSEAPMAGLPKIYALSQNSTPTPSIRLLRSSMHCPGIVG